MARTTIGGRQITDASVQRADLDVSTVGQAVVAKLVQGTNITLVSTGGDAGTGDVTISAGSGSLTTQNTDYTFAIGDAGNTILHDSGTAHTYTIPANSSVNFSVNTIINIINNNGAGDITLAITTDTLRRSDGTTTTGSITIKANTIATIVKTKTTEWFVSASNAGYSFQTVAVSRYPSVNIVIPNGYGTYIPNNLEIPSGVSYELANNAVLEIG
jgi:hypothetical protein